MELYKYNKERQKIIKVLNSVFGQNKRYDISSDIYSRDLYDDLIFIKKNIKTIKDIRVLDVGCGKGHISALISSFLNIKVHAIDLESSYGEGGHFDTDSLGKKWQTVIWKKLKNNYSVNYKYYDGIKLPYKNHIFDIIIAYAVIKHVDDEDRFLKNCYKSLKKGGRLFIFRCPSNLSFTEFLCKQLRLPHHSKLYSKKDLSLILRRNKFLIESIEKYDTIPAFTPKGMFQNIWNRSYKLTRILQALLTFYPFNIFSHHFR